MLPQQGAGFGIGGRFVLPVRLSQADQLAQVYHFVRNRDALIGAGKMLRQIRILLPQHADGGRPGCDIGLDIGLGSIHQLMLAG